MMTLKARAQVEECKLVVENGFQFHVGRVGMSSSESRDISANAVLLSVFLLKVKTASFPAAVSCPGAVWLCATLGELRNKCVAPILSGRPSSVLLQF